MISVSGLTKSYAVGDQRHFVFRDVSFQFPPKTNVGILGPNGAGKSTLLRILGGIDHPDCGEIQREASISWPLGLRGGFVGHLTGRENCRMVCRAYGLKESLLKEKIERVKELSGIGAYFEQPVGYYSSGMGGRLGFALSMAFDFDYFLIDEITSVGDAHFKSLAKRILDEKRATSNVIMISHSMGDLKRFCDIAVLVRGGNVTVFEDFEEAIAHYLPKTQISMTEAELFEDSEQNELKVEPKDQELRNSVRLIAMRLSALLKCQRQGDARWQPTAHEMRPFAVSLIRLGLPDLARQVAELALAEDRYHIGCHVVRVQALSGLDDDASMAEAVKEALELDENHPVFNFEQSILSFKSGDFQGALASVKKALLASPDNSRFWWQMARVERAMGSDSAALMACSRGLAQSSPSPRLARLRGEVLMDAGRVEEALLALESENSDRYKTVIEETLETIERIEIPEELLI